MQPMRAQLVVQLSCGGNTTQLGRAELGSRLRGQLGPAAADLMQLDEGAAGISERPNGSASELNRSRARYISSAAELTSSRAGLIISVPKLTSSGAELRTGCVGDDGAGCSLRVPDAASRHPSF